MIDHKRDIVQPETSDIIKMKKILPLPSIKRGKFLFIAFLFAFLTFSVGTFALDSYYKPPAVQAQGTVPCNQGEPGCVCTGNPGTGLSCNKPVPAVDVSENWIVKDIQILVDFLSVGVGIIVIGVIIFGGIRYAAAGDNPQAVAAAKQWIINGLIALVAYIFTFAFLQWVVPGGVF